MGKGRSLREGVMLVGRCLAVGTSAIPRLLGLLSQRGRCKREIETAEPLRCLQVSGKTRAGWEGWDVLLCQGQGFSVGLGIPICFGRILSFPEQGGCLRSNM